jgi:U3 small nucleolar ribonucleoprotein protein IMP3
MRELKFHEKKLLKKVDFVNWKNEENVREVKILRRYHIQKREDIKMYNLIKFRYNKIAGTIRKLVNKLKQLNPSDTYRIKKTKDLVEKLHNIGLIKTQSNLAECDKVGISTFCRRRLSYLLFKNKYCENVKEAVTFIEQGQVKIGTELVTDPAFLVTRFNTINIDH